MPGIRIKSPVGDGWQYSLDKLAWQDQPVFYALPGGSPFVAGNTYPIYYRNLPLGQQGQDSIIFGQQDTEGAGLSRALRKLTDKDWRYICAMLGSIGCAGSGTGPVITPKFSFVHYEFVAKPIEPVYDYVLSDGTYAGTFDQLTETVISGWAVKRGVGPQNVDIKGRPKGSLEALRTIQLNVTPNNDRPDVITAPGINTPTATRCGFKVDLPDMLKTGTAWEVHVFIAGTGIPLKASPRSITVAATLTPVAGAYQLVGSNVDAGGLARQQTLQQLWSDQVYRDAAARNWDVKDDQNKLIAGVAIPNGLLKADAGSVAQTSFVTIGCQPADSDQYVSAKRQIVATGCVRESGLTTYTATWNMAPSGGNAHRFDTLAQANAEMGAYFDQPTQYLTAQFKLQVASLSVGTKVYYRDDRQTCERVDDGIYYLTDSANGNTVKKAIRVKDGLIAEVLASNYVTPAPLPDTAWATMTDPFTQANPNYLPSNGTVWTVAGGTTCINVDSMVRGDTGSLILDVEADRILALLSVGARDITDPRYGVGLKYTRELDTNGSGKGGYNLLLTRNNNTNLVQFLFDHIAFGPYYPYEWQPNTRYYVAMRYTAIDSSTARLDGKVWKESEIEPAAWPYTWTVSPRSGQAALVGGSNYPGEGNKAMGCFDQVWVQTPHVAPRLINVAQGKPVIAPANTLGDGWRKELLTDTDPGTCYSTDCLAETTPVALIIDTNGLAPAEQVALQPRGELPGAFPIDYTIDGSTDGLTWTMLLSIQNQPRQTAELILNLPASNGVYAQYRYFRLRSTRNGRANDTDCIRVQLGGFRVLAPVLNPLPAAQQSSLLEIGRAFVGSANRRDLLYFVKNGVAPSSATGIAPTWGFKNLTTGSPDSLGAKSEMYSLDQWGDPGPAWASIFNQAKQQGFAWFAYANAGSVGQNIRFRFGGNAAESTYQEFDFTVPDDGTNLNLMTIFPV